ncbi:MAG: DUF2183 domain-containing protein [Flavobacteriaceae bacterium]|nr:DUF2183 domain-containing protein [Flavobacteriaceae bacterium]
MSFLKRAWLDIKDNIQEWTDNDEVCVRPYLSYATREKIIIRGRVLENEGVVSIEENTVWDNFVQTIRMLESDEKKNTQILIEYEDKIFTTQTDDEGYFYSEIYHSHQEVDTDQLVWKTVNVTATEELNETGVASTAKAQFLLPHARTEFIIVSDIDDTVIETGVNSFLKLEAIFKTLFKNHQTRTPFDGIAEVFHKLQHNSNGQQVNPVFYLSNSPWNLYHMIKSMFKFRDIPLGPMFLRDFGIKFGKERIKFNQHKKINLERLMLDFHDKIFVLIGDATEKDAPIYLEIYNKFPSRVKKIFIRASSKERQNEEIRNLIAQNPNAPFHLITHSDEILLNM